MFQTTNQVGMLHYRMVNLGPPGDHSGTSFDRNLRRQLIRALVLVAVKRKTALSKRIPNTTKKTHPVPSWND